MGACKRRNLQIIPTFENFFHYTSVILSIKFPPPGLTDFIIINFDHPGGREHFSRPFHCREAVNTNSIGVDLSATLKVTISTKLAMA